MFGDGNNMMLNDNSKMNIEQLKHLTKMAPCTNHFQIHHVHNVELRKKWSLPPRIINDYILAFIRGGNGHYKIENQLFPIREGNIFIISPGVTFSTEQYDLTPSLLSVRFGVYDNISKNENTKVTRPFYIYHVPKDVEHYRQQFSKIYSLFLSGKNVLMENAILSLTLGNILLDIENGSNKHDYDMRIESARVYIEKNIQENFTIEHLAKIAGLSMPYFSKKFKQQYNLSPKSYIFNAKMQYAKILLSEYKYTVKETAYSLGYSDPYIFSNQFKAFWGFPPSKAKIF